MADPIYTVGSVQIPSQAYGASAPVSIPRDARMFAVAKTGLGDHVFFEYVAGETELVDQFISVLGLNVPQDRSPLLAPIILGLLQTNPVSVFPLVAWQVYPST